MIWGFCPVEFSRISPPLPPLISLLPSHTTLYPHCFPPYYNPPFHIFAPTTKLPPLSSSQVRNHVRCRNCSSYLKCGDMHLSPFTLRYLWLCTNLSYILTHGEFDLMMPYGAIYIDLCPLKLWYSSLEL